MNGQGAGLMTRRRWIKTGAALAGAAFVPKGWRVLARSREPVQLGIILPYSGVYAQLGQDITNGMTLYFESVGGEAGGRPIRMIREDETADPEVAVRRVRKLVESDRVDLVSGLVNTAAAYALRDFVHDTETILLVSNAGGNALTRDRRSPYIFRTSFTSWQCSYPFGRWVKENMADRVFILSSDYAFGHESAAGFKQSFQEAGGQIIDEVYTPLGSSDFGSYITRIARARPEAVYGFLAGSDGVIFTRQFAQYGLSQSIRLAVSGFMVEEDVLDAVKQEALGAFSSLHWALRLDNPVNEAFVDAYRRRFNATPSVYSMQGYDTARVIVEGLNAVAGDVDRKRDLMEAMRHVQFHGPRGLFEFDPESQHVIQNVYVREVKQFGSEVANDVVSDLGRFRDPV